MLEQIVFYVFSAVVVLAAIGVISFRNPVHAALSLVVAFFGSSVLWMLLEAEFLAITLVLVYVGAVMVLFLFVVMMLDINLSVLREGFQRYLPVGAAVAGLLAAGMFAVVGSERFGLSAMPGPDSAAADANNTRTLGLQLYTDYVYPFEIASVVLLVAIVAAIALTLRRRPDNKYQRPEKQVRVTAKDRIRVVSMDVEERK